MAGNNDLLLEIEEEEDGFSLYHLVETLIENRLFRRTVENSMETYNEELFRKRDDVRLSKDGFPWTAEDDAAWSSAEEKKCYVCLEAIEVGNLMVRLECRHLFHHACIENAVAHQHVRCPLCRHTIATYETKSQTNESGHRINFPE